MNISDSDARLEDETSGNVFCVEFFYRSSLHFYSDANSYQYRPPECHALSGLVSPDVLVQFADNLLTIDRSMALRTRLSFW